jgi:hypothetical protein
MLHPETASEPPTRKVSKILGKRTSIIIDLRRSLLPSSFSNASITAPGEIDSEGPTSNDTSITGIGNTHNIMIFPRFIL